MRYAELKPNDTVNCEKGICVSLWMQGCPHHCSGCFNPETWDFAGGRPIDLEALICMVDAAINKNGLERNFSILGGEPLCPQNVKDTIAIIETIRALHPSIKIFVWTGYTEEYLVEQTWWKELTNIIDCAVVGPFVESERDITLPLMGSRNQKRLDFKRSE